jgi:hypothetical protein
VTKPLTQTAEGLRLEQDAERTRNWKRWGPYLSERQWGTVREDYSADGSSWDYFPHDHARSRAYRWGEDGLLGLCDRECRLCFAIALWNGNDPILKERLFGLSNREGNHAEDVKECYYYLDSTPTHSYMKALYKYPHRAYPYQRLIDGNAARSIEERELELEDLGVFDEDRYFDVFVEYAKAAEDDVLIRITAANRGPEAATLHVIPTVWFRNTWSWGRVDETAPVKPRLSRVAVDQVFCEHPTLGRFVFAAAPGPFGGAPGWLFTENVTNAKRLFDAESESAFVKDAFHRFLVDGQSGVVNPARTGTKAGACYRVELPAGGSQVFRLRLCAEAEKPETWFGSSFDATIELRRREADQFYATALDSELDEEERSVSRQAYAGLLWSKQFYHYVVRDWLEGDPAQPAPPAARRAGRNHDWPHLFNRDVISMPDKWEYPWYAAWDLAFHLLPMAQVDPELAKQQLVLFLREWYMHPNGQLPAYEWALSDVNPPVHAWAAWRVYKISGERGSRDRVFLERVFQKLLLNFTWWVNRKDPDGNHLFSGGFLGLDNVGLFDRSKPIPGGGTLSQADGTAWMAFYCGTMLSIALELAREDPVYEDVASKFFEHFIAIADAMNTLGGAGLWNEEDGFYYDLLHLSGEEKAVRVRSMVGLFPLMACELLEDETIARLPGFGKRLRWFLAHRADLARHISYMEHAPGGGTHACRLLAIPSRERLERVLRVMLDEREFLSPYGIRSLSAAYRDEPYRVPIDGTIHEVRYAPAESRTTLFGGNSNWRGPVWFPANYLLIEALERYHHFYGDAIQVELPTGSGNRVTLDRVAADLQSRLARLFLPDASGRRPCHGDDLRYAKDPHWRELALFYEYFDGDVGRGVGASHQTGWTALAVRCIEEHSRRRILNARAASARSGLEALPAG